MDQGATRGIWPDVVRSNIDGILDPGRKAGLDDTTYYLHTHLPRLQPESSLLHARVSL